MIRLFKSRNAKERYIKKKGKKTRSDNEDNENEKYILEFMNFPFTKMNFVALMKMINHIIRENQESIKKIARENREAI